MPLDKDKIRQLYLIKKLTVSQIASRLGFNIGPIYRVLKEMSITRSRSDAQRLHLTGKHPGNWKGGRYQEDSGYILVYLQPNDFFRPMADKRGYVREHRLVMAKHLGRCLESWEIVHHRNGIRSDNRLENLSLMPSQSEHLPSARTQQEITRLRKQVIDLGKELKECKAALLAIWEMKGE